MMTLNDEPSKQEEIKGLWGTLYNELLELSVTDAEEYMRWFIKNTIQNKQHLQETQLRAELKKLGDKTDSSSLTKKLNVGYTG